ncbi:Pycsar system effector family protein [Streptomyces jumonjinensis]|uniref:Pycsar system effector family protein n=1 Tax=Streptomyces jumonjinensis TaxID=1945 RepID=UPI003333EDE8
MSQQPTTPVTADDAKLDKALAYVTGEITRTDTKAGALLTSFSIPLAVLVAVVPGRNLPTASTVLVAIGALGLVAAMVVVLLVVRPRISGAPRGSYLYWADCTADQVLEDVATDRRAERIASLSRILRTKYKALRLAIEITAASLAVLAGALLAGLV